jgi:acetyl esterase
MNTLVKGKNEASGKYTESEFKMTVDEGVEIDVLVSKPKTAGPHGALIFAHGGGGCLMTAKSYKHAVIEYGIELECVTFNVDYRLGPATKAPGGVMDFYKTVKHIIEKAADWDVDPAKIILCGESGGSMIVCGAAYELAKNDEAHLIKNMWLQCPMISNENANVPYGELNFFEKVGFTDMQNLYKMLATDWEKQQSDFHLLPGRMPAEMLKKLPPTVVWTSEFDMIRRDAVAFINRMEEADAPLLDYLSVAGGAHGYENFELGPLRTLFHDSMIAAWKNYVLDQKNQEV